MSAVRRRWPFHDRAVPVISWRIVTLLVALLAEAWNVKKMLGSGEPATEHFAYFTVQSNILVVIMMLWMLLVPTASRIRVHRAVWWMLYPVGYLVCSWLRGALIDGWYPYPFLDPGVHDGWVGLLWPTGQVLLAFCIGIGLVAGLGALRYRTAPDARARSSSSLTAKPSSTSSSPQSNSSP